VTAGVNEPVLNSFWKGCLIGNIIFIWLVLKELIQRRVKGAKRTKTMDDRSFHSLG
jgi:hypothetical protein